jgi:predicted nucleotidyltransferase
MTLDEAKMASYRIGWHRRQDDERQTLVERYTRAIPAARTAARILREQFVASRVRLFGSLLHPESFRKHSDIDLAVEGIDESLVLKAWCAISSVAPEFEFDLVTPDECRAEIWASIESEGIEI